MASESKDMQLGLSELSVISWMSGVEGCPLSRVQLYSESPQIMLRHRHNFLTRPHNSGDVYKQTRIKPVKQDLFLRFLNLN